MSMSDIDIPGPAAMLGSGQPHLLEKARRRGRNSNGDCFCKEFNILQIDFALQLVGYGSQQ
jgi:hypothetical protein